ncbi:uncharacterized protein LOC113494030 [Trichoplusia ni]|uniref:Uncharacterized protein LOC113494030 n=1 Tax=Trichoplusia ni TaxID=7111 RepID=A0A7E5VID5_TRINI|nr:uncharacterized protein LOC113494030 [Trichoplusia ni]
MDQVVRHPKYPESNVLKLGGYDPNNYGIVNVSPTLITSEAVTPGRPPYLTQKAVGKFLEPLTKELMEVPPRPTIDELDEAVIDKMVNRDKAFWVDKPGANDYTLHDAYYSYGIFAEVIQPTHQDVFPRSYQYDLDCVKYRRLHACDGLKPQPDGKQIPLKAHCRDCRHMDIHALTPFQLAWAKDPGQRRWRYYPDLTADLTPQQIRKSMVDVGRPFQNEACNWYYKNYPPVKHYCIIRKFSK